MLAVLDGLGDALTREHHAGIATGRPGGHLDLPRMRAGGVRAAIFSVFTPSPGRQDVPAPEPVSHEVAAAYASTAAGRLLALERAGAVRVARNIEDLDAAHLDGAAPAAVLHLEGAEAIDPGLDALDVWYAAGLRSLGPVWSRPKRVRPRRSVRLSVLAGHRPWADDRRPDAGEQMLGARGPARPQPHERGGVLGRGAARAGAARVQQRRRPPPVPDVSQPDRRAA